MENLIDSLVRAADAVAAYYQAAARGADAAAEATRALTKANYGAPVATRCEKPCADKKLTLTPDDVKKEVAAAAGVSPALAGKPEPAAPVTPAADPATPQPEKRKAGRPKKNVVPLPDAPAAPKSGTTEQPSGLPVDPEFASLTEEESTKRVYEVGEAMMDAYPKEEAGKNAPDGSPAPEGFFIAAEILKTRFGVEKLSKLNHAQRLQFMTILKGYLGRAQTPASESSPAGEIDPNLGV